MTILIFVSCSNLLDNIFIVKAVQLGSTNTPENSEFLPSCRESTAVPFGNSFHGKHFASSDPAESHFCSSRGSPRSSNWSHQHWDLYARQKGCQGVGVKELWGQSCLPYRCWSVDVMLHQFLELIDALRKEENMRIRYPSGGRGSNCIFF